MAESNRNPTQNKDKDQERGQRDKNRPDQGRPDAQQSGQANDGQRANMPGQFADRKNNQGSSNPDMNQNREQAGRRHGPEDDEDVKTPASENPDFESGDATRQKDQQPL